MIELRNECVGCIDIGLPCLGSGCPNKRVPRLVCDDCHYDIDEDEYYTYDGKDYHDVCILKVLVENGTIERKAQ